MGIRQCGPDCAESSVLDNEHEGVILMVHLLAYDGIKDNERQGTLGRIMHDTSKWFMRESVNGLHRHMKPVFNYKRANGWHKEHITAMGEAIDWVVSLDEIPINARIGGFKGPDDKNRRLFLQMKDIFLTLLDEDTHYDIRVLLVLKWIHEHWDRFEIAAEQAYQIQNFSNLYKDLLALSEPLPVDDGNGKDDNYKIDARKKYGLERDG